MKPIRALIVKASNAAKFAVPAMVVTSLVGASFVSVLAQAQDAPRTTVLEGLDSFAPRLEERPGAYGGIENGYRNRAGRWVVHGYVYDDLLQMCDPAWIAIARQDVELRNLSERTRLKGNFEHGKPLGKIVVDYKREDVTPEFLNSSAKTISDIEQLLARKDPYTPGEYFIKGQDRASLEGRVKEVKEALEKLVAQASTNAQSELFYSETDPGVPVGQWTLRDTTGKVTETRSYSAEGKLLERTLDGAVVEMDQYTSGGKKQRVPATPPSMQSLVKYCEDRAPTLRYSETLEAMGLAAVGYKVVDRDKIIGTFVDGKPSGKIKVVSGSADKFNGTVVAELEFSETTPGVPSGAWVLRDRYGQLAENRMYSATGSLIEQRRFNGKSTDGLYRNRDGFIQKVDLVDGYASCEMEEGTKVRFDVNQIGVIKRTSELRIAESSPELVTTLDSQALRGLRGKDALQSDCPTLLGLAKEAAQSERQEAIEKFKVWKNSDERAKLEARTRGGEGMRRAICLIMPALKASLPDECREQFPGIEAEAENFRKQIADAAAVAAPAPVVAAPVIPSAVTVDSALVGIKTKKAPVSKAAPKKPAPKKPIKRAAKGV